MSSATSDDDVSDWQSLKRQADGVVNLAVGHPHPEALPNAILARAFERAAAGLVAPSDASVDGRSARVPMSYVARRGDPAAIDALATFLSDAYAEGGKRASWQPLNVDETTTPTTRRKRRKPPPARRRERAKSRRKRSVHDTSRGRSDVPESLRTSRPPPPTTAADFHAASSHGDGLLSLGSTASELVPAAAAAAAALLMKESRGTLRNSSQKED